MIGESAEKERVPTKESQENISHPEYTRLLNASGAYQEIQKQGGWPKVPMGRLMKKGSSGDRVLALRDRLLVSGDLSSEEAGNKTFDQDLQEAVKRFQRRPALEMDGVVGPATLEALNISVEERIRQIEINLKRWERTPEDLGTDYIAVNIADYRLQVVEGGRPLFGMRVAVGKDYTRTPVFSARMTDLVFRPYWNIPSSIATKEILPIIKKDSGYLEKNRIQVLKGWDKAEKKMDPKLDGLGRRGWDYPLPERHLQQR